MANPFPAFNKPTFNQPAFNQPELSPEEKRLKQSVGYECVLFRQGQLHLAHTPEHRRKLREFMPPLRGPRWKDHFKHPYFGRNQVYDVIPFSRIAPKGEQEKVGDRFRDVDKSTKVVTAMERAHYLVESRSKFRIVKTLGWGGMGCALLAELEDPKDGKLQRIVIKMNLKAKYRDAFREEKRNHIRMARATHVIHSLVVEDKFMKQPGQDDAQGHPGTPRTKRKHIGDAADPAYFPSKKRLTHRGVMERAQALLHPPKGANDFHRQGDEKYNLNTHPEIIVIEPMMRGELDIWVRKMAHSGHRFHSKVLWLIFECCKCILPR